MSINERKYVYLLWGLERRDGGEMVAFSRINPMRFNQGTTTNTGLLCFITELDSTSKSGFSGEVGPLLLHLSALPNPVPGLSLVQQHLLNDVEKFSPGI